MKKFKEYLESDLTEATVRKGSVKSTVRRLQKQIKDISKKIHRTSDINQKLDLIADQNRFTAALTALAIAIDQDDLLILNRI